MNDDQTQNTADTNSETAVDSKGTDQETARAILRELRDKEFEGADDKLAFVLGRPVEEVTAIMNGHEKVDDDVIMKARGIAMQRNVELSQ